MAEDTPCRVLHVHPPAVAVPASLTSGLGRLGGHPDLVVLDMPPPSAHRYLHAVGRRVRAGARLRAGDMLDGLHESFRFGLVEVRDTGFLRALDRWYADHPCGPRGPLLQLVWPDLTGLLPWEPGYDLRVSGLRQPLLGPWPRRGSGAGRRVGPAPVTGDDDGREHAGAHTNR
jgi:hypothetical protein